MDLPPELILQVDQKEVGAILPRIRAEWRRHFPGKKPSKASWRRQLFALWEVGESFNHEYLQKRQFQAVCSNNCPTCCHQAVVCRKMEIEIVIDWLNKQSAGLRGRIVSQVVDRVGVQTYIAERHKLVNVPGHHAMIRLGQVLIGEPCAFLSPDGQCGVYPVRPINCRTARSAEKCRIVGSQVVGKTTDTPVDAACHVIANEIQTEIEESLVFSLVPSWLIYLAKTIRT